MRCCNNYTKNIAVELVKTWHILIYFSIEKAKKEKFIQICFQTKTFKLGVLILTTFVQKTQKNECSKK